MKMFRSSLRGFRKSDVNNYIIEIHREFADRVEELEGELHNVSAEKDRLSAELTLAAEDAKRSVELASRAEEAERNLETANTENKALQEKLRILEIQLEALTQSTATAEETANRREVENEKMKNLLRLIASSTSNGEASSADLASSLNPLMSP